jgi:hypothetical protein
LECALLKGIFSFLYHLFSFFIFSFSLLSFFFILIDLGLDHLVLHAYFFQGPHYSRVEDVLSFGVELVDHAEGPCTGSGVLPFIDSDVTLLALPYIDLQVYELPIRPCIPILLKKGKRLRPGDSPFPIQRQRNFSLFLFSPFTFLCDFSHPCDVLLIAFWSRTLMSEDLLRAASIDLWMVDVLAFLFYLLLLLLFLQPLNLHPCFLNQKP